MSIPADDLPNRAVLPMLLLLMLASPAVAGTCIGVELRFSGPEPPSDLVQALQVETSAIWAAYDVLVQWSDLPSPDRCEKRSASFNAVIDDDRRDSPSKFRVTLGSTREVVPRAGRVPILVHRRAAEALIKSLTSSELTRLVGHPSPGFDDVGRGLGRILAHEIGHVLLAAADHRSKGLMRADFGPEDLVMRQRWRFTLSDAELGRLPLGEGLRFADHTKASSVTALPRLR